MPGIDQGELTVDASEMGELREAFTAAHNAMGELVSQFCDYPANTMPTVMILASAGWAMTEIGAEGTSEMLRKMADQIDRGATFVKARTIN